MKNYTEISRILWDFDGVLMNSNAVRDMGFERVLEAYPKDEVEQLMVYHRKNGGLSRYVKFRYFLEEVRKEAATEEQIMTFASTFSVIMKELLTDASLLIQETLSFVKANYQNVPMHIVSGSDGNELRYLCSQLGIDQYFVSIHGSPTPKKELVAQVLEKEGGDKNTIVFIGDSINDYDAAKVNGLPFVAYNNQELDHLSDLTIDWNGIIRLETAAQP